MSSELALTIINDGTSYAQRCKLAAAELDTYRRDMLAVVTIPAANAYRARFGRHFSKLEINQATDEVCDYMLRHVKESRNA